MAKRQIETITGRHDAITDVQLDFLRHPGFVYFRKGEFAHALEVAWMHLDVISSVTKYGISVSSGITVAMLNTRLQRWRQSSSSRPTKGQRDLRFIMCAKNATSDSLVGAEALVETGWKKGLIEPEQAGRLRYFVSAQEYFMFFGNRDGSFQGLRGKDAETRECLRNLFLDEWRPD